MSTTVKSIDDWTPLVGTHLGFSDYYTITQEQVNLFAESTGDHQWIHIDPVRAAAGPFGHTIAHGYLTLALIPVLLSEVVRVDGVSMGVNYGTNRVRFTNPVVVGSQIRAGATLASLEPIANGVQVTLDVVVEVRDAPKPSCVAQVVYRYYH